MCPGPRCVRCAAVRSIPPELPDAAALPVSAHRDPPGRKGTASGTGPRPEHRTAPAAHGRPDPEQSNEVLGALAVLLGDRNDGPKRCSTWPPTRIGCPGSTTRTWPGWYHDPGGHPLGAARANRTELRGSRTWAWGLDRLLLGVAMSKDRIGDVLPVDDIQGGDAALVGRLAELVTRLRGLRAGPGKHPMSRCNKTDPRSRI